MTPPTRGWKVMRDAALSLALRHPFAGALANPRQMTPYTYADSPITFGGGQDFDGGPTPGAVARNVRLEDGFLSDRFGTGFTLLVFGEMSGRAALEDAAGAELTIVSLPATGAAAEAYGASDGTACLIRPDQHVAARWKQASGEDVAGTLAAILGGQGEQ